MNGYTQIFFTISLDSLNGLRMQALDDPRVTPQNIVMGAPTDPEEVIAAWYLQRYETTDFYRLINTSRDTAITIAGNLSASSVSLTPPLPPNAGFGSVSQEWFLEAAQNPNRAPSYQIVNPLLQKALEYGENDDYGSIVGTGAPDGPDGQGEGTYWTFVPLDAIASYAPTLQASSSAAPGGTNFLVNVTFPDGAPNGVVLQCTIAGNAPTLSVTPNFMSFLTIGTNPAQGMGFSYFAPANQLGPLGSPVTIMLEDGNQNVVAITQAIIQG